LCSDFYKNKNPVAFAIISMTTCAFSSQAKVEPRLNLKSKGVSKGPLPLDYERLEHRCCARGEACKATREARDATVKIRTNQRQKSIAKGEKETKINNHFRDNGNK
jgi:hypothetical protein